MRVVFVVPERIAGVDMGGNRKIIERRRRCDRPLQSSTIPWITREIAILGAISDVTTSCRI